MRNRITGLLASAVLLAVSALVGVTSAEAAERADCPWVGSDAPIEERVGAVLAEMTQAEKLHMVSGTGGSIAPSAERFVGVVPAIPRLCIPQLNLGDGGGGVGGWLRHVTQLPAPIAAGSTWDRDLNFHYESVVGEEFKHKGGNVLLAPAMDIIRDPRWGRSMETSSEDPYLNARLGVAQIEGIQEHDVIAQAKHYAVYVQELLRDTEVDDHVVDERTLHEIYLPMFEAAVKEADVASVMCAYNLVNGQPTCGNEYLTNQVLKGMWGFDGFVTTDWFAQRNSIGAAENGVDMQMPDNCFYGPALERNISLGLVAQSRLDDMVKRILRQAFEHGLFDREPLPAEAIKANVRSTEHAKVARTVAERGMVLLRNEDQVLPLKAGGKVAVLGRAEGPDVYSGVRHGALSVFPDDVVTPLQGIEELAGKDNVRYERGTDPAKAAAVAKDADVAIVVAGRLQGEFEDLPRSVPGLFGDPLNLPKEENDLIQAVAAANPNTVVVLNTGTAATMPWLGDVAGVVQAWYPGEQYGHALASVLYGLVDASGRLPMTFPTDITQTPAYGDPSRYPGVLKVQHSDGTSVGYRWYDTQDIEPLFPFGFGLSYTTFKFSGLQVGKPSASGAVTVRATVTNTGQRAGSQVAQLYLEQPADGAPPRQLKGFQRVDLEPGESAQVRFTVAARDQSYFDVTEHRWKAAAGTYRVRVGSSSRDLPLSGTFARTSTAATSKAVPAARPADNPVTAAAKKAATVVDVAQCLQSYMTANANGLLSFGGTTGLYSTANNVPYPKDIPRGPCRDFGPKPCDRTVLASGGGGSSTGAAELAETGLNRNLIPTGLLLVALGVALLWGAAPASRRT